MLPPKQGCVHTFPAHRQEPERSFPQRFHVGIYHTSASVRALLNGTFHGSLQVYLLPFDLTAEQLDVIQKPQIMF